MRIYLYVEGRWWCCEYRKFFFISYLFIFFVLLQRCAEHALYTHECIIHATERIHLRHVYVYDGNE